MKAYHGRDSFARSQALEMDNIRFRDNWMRISLLGSSRWCPWQTKGVTMADKVEKQLADAADTIEKIIAGGEIPCDENVDRVQGSADVLREVVQEIEGVETRRRNLMPS